MSYLNPIRRVHFSGTVKRDGSKKQKHQRFAPSNKESTAHKINAGDEENQHDLKSVEKMRAKFAKTQAFLKNYRKEKGFSIKNLKVTLQQIESTKSKNPKKLQHLHKMLPKDIFHMIKEDPA